MSHRPKPEPGAAGNSWASIQDENGVDLTLIRANLKLTPQERLERADTARRQAEYILSHARRIDPSASQGDAAPTELA